MRALAPRARISAHRCGIAPLITPRLLCQLRIALRVKCRRKQLAK
jgi:hypothetical protein